MEPAQYGYAFILLCFLSPAVALEDMPRTRKTEPRKRPDGALDGRMLLQHTGQRHADENK